MTDEQRLAAPPYVTQTWRTGPNAEDTFCLPTRKKADETPQEWQARHVREVKAWQEIPGLKPWKKEGE